MTSIPRSVATGRKVSGAQARFRELAADPMGEPDPVLDRLTYHRAPVAAPSAPEPTKEAEAEPEAEAG